MFLSAIGSSLYDQYSWLLEKFASNQTLGHSVKTWIYVLLVMLKFFSTQKIKEDEIKYWNINGKRTFWRCCFFTKRKNLYLVSKVTFLALLAMSYAELCTASLINQIVVVFANSRMKLLSEGLRNIFAQDCKIRYLRWIYLIFHVLVTCCSRKLENVPLPRAAGSYEL